MGASLDRQQQLNLGQNGKLISRIEATSQELQSLQKIFAQRSRFNYLYLCSAEKIAKQADQHGIFCQDFTRIIIQYQFYDHLLSQAYNNQPMPQLQIEKIIFSVCSALSFLHQKNYRHGDIQPKLICYQKGDWKLLDNYFIRGGISAYEKVLERDEGFISPTQMEKIRHGFVRQSPPILETDEIFGLGMTCLQLMTGKPSSQLYKQSYLRFNETAINQSINLVKNIFPDYFSRLVLSMIEMDENKRIKIKDIMSQAFISQHSKKSSSSNRISRQ